jgi:hypothetical protein
MTARIRSAKVILTACLGLLGGGGGSDEDPAAYAKKQMKEQEKPRPPSDIKTVSVPVPEGKKVPCASWLDPAVFTAALGDQVTLVDKSASETEPTSVCSLVRGGEALNEKEQMKKWEKEGMRLGVLPGDEYCLVHLTCSYVATMDGLRKKCGQEGNTGNEAVGQFACVHQTQRGPEWAYAYTTVDPDTSCGLAVQGGPSVTDETLVQRCTQAALATLTPAGIQANGGSPVGANDLAEVGSRP